MPQARDENQANHPARSSIATALGLLLFGPFCGVLIAALLFGYAVSQTSDAPMHVNLAGQQRMFAVQLGGWAKRVAAGQDDYREKVREQVAGIDRALVIFVKGGEVDGRRMAPLPAAVRDEFVRSGELWKTVRDRLLIIAAQPVGSPDFERAYRGLDGTIEALRANSDGLAAALQHRTERVWRAIAWSLAIFAGLSFALFIIGMRYVRRHIIDPLKMLDSAAWRIADRDYSVRVMCSTQNEVSHLCETFNEMASRLAKFREVIGKRRKYAEILAESLPIGIVLLNRDLVVIQSNHRFCEYIGEPGSGEFCAALGRTITDLLPFKGLAGQLAAAMKDGRVVETRGDLPAPEGPRPVRVKAVIARFLEQDVEEKGAGVQLLLTVEDLTHEEKLRCDSLAAEKSFRLLIEALPDAIAVYRDGHLVYLNEAMVSALGYDAADDLVGIPFLDLVQIAEEEAVRERIRAMSEGTPRRSPLFEMNLMRRDGSSVVMETRFQALPFGGEPAIVVIARDLTERNKFTAKMMEMDRMFAVGTLAAGIGHEINNPLTYVIANLDILARELAKPPAARQEDGPDLAVIPQAHTLRDLLELLRDAREGADRVRNIVRDLKAFSRTESEQCSFVDVRSVLEAAIRMTSNEIRHRARLMKDYNDVPPIEANEARLVQVFVNLLVNAAQAIPVGAADVNTIRLRTRCDGDWVVVDVEDSGRGISDEHLPRLFDPFFTTKPVGEGMGLGLAICWQIVESCGGRIEVERAVGRGMIFHIILPAARTASEAAIAASPPKPASNFDAPRRRGRILLVDDEPVVCRSIDRILAPEHEITALTSADEASRLIAAGERYDVILCDLMMPEMTGMELHSQISAVAPEQAAKMIFLSGGAFTFQAREFLDSVPNLRIDKPFDMNNLRALVHGILNQGAAPR